MADEIGSRFFDDGNLAIGSREYPKITLLYGKYGRGKTHFLSERNGLLYMPIGMEQGEGGWSEEAQAMRAKMRPMCTADLWNMFKEARIKYIKTGDVRVEAFGFDSLRGVFDLAFAENQSLDHASAVVRRFLRESQALRNVTDAEVYLTCGEGISCVKDEVKVYPNLYGLSELNDFLCYTVDNLWWMSLSGDRRVLVTREICKGFGCTVAAKTRGRLPAVTTADWSVCGMTFEMYLEEAKKLVSVAMSRQDKLSEMLIEAHAEGSYDRIDEAIALALSLSP